MDRFRSINPHILGSDLYGREKRMIKTLKINRFKLFESIVLEDLSPITLIGGKNNVGKTSILEAIFTFYDRGNPNVTLRQLSWRGVSALPMTPEAMWAPLFYEYELSKPIDIEVIESKRRERLRIRHNTRYVRSLPTPTPTHSGTSATPQIRTDPQTAPTVSLDFTYYVNNKEKDSAHIILESGQMGMYIDHLSQRKIITCFPSTVPPNTNETAERFGNLDVKGELEEVVRIMKIIEPRLKSMTSVTEGNNSMIYGDIGLDRKVPIPYMGEGTAKLLAYVLAIANSENGIVLIDEIENGLHHSILPEVWEAIAAISEKYNCQVILTTHSYEAIKAMITGLSNIGKKRWSYIRLDREDNDIVPQNYTPENLQSAMDGDWEIR